MLDALEEIRSDSSLWNPFFRSARLEELRHRVENLPEDLALLDRLQVRLDLGLTESRFGSLQAAIDQLEIVRSQLPPQQEVTRARVTVELALGYLRLGERQNCLANHSGESCIVPIRGGGVHTMRDNTDRAIELFLEALETIPPRTLEHVAVRWLASVAYMAAGRYPGDVPAAVLLPPAIFASGGQFARFENVAPHVGLAVVDHAGGAVVEDLDGDSLLDVLTSSWAPTASLRLLRNLGDGGFEEVTEAAGLTGLTGGLNLVRADYDNDGDADVLVLRGAWMGRNGRHPNSLLRNSGDGRFVDVSFEAGLADVRRPTQAAAWSDYDNDGDLDLYVGNEGSQEEFPAQLFRNNADGTFTDVAALAGVENRRFAKGVAWGDYDGDRWPDLYVSNFSEPNRLYRNQGDGTFEDVAPRLGVTEPASSFPAWFWDFDNDGALDLYVASFPYSADAGLYNLYLVVAGYLGVETGADRPRLYRGNGEGGFEEVGMPRGLGRAAMTMGANFGDLDNDGFLDFYLGTGYPDYDGLIPNVLYRNLRGQRFEDVTMATGTGHLQKGHGVVFADLDGDGDQDLFEQVGGFYPDDDFANALWENPGPSGHWLKVKLVGVRSNRSGIGARIEAQIAEGEERRSIHRHVGSVGGFGSAPVVQHLGLGEATRVERLEIYWPTSDTTQVFREVAVDRAIQIVEGADEYREIPMPSFRFARKVH
jgi:hypothetical protein